MSRIFPRKWGEGQKMPVLWETPNQAGKGEDSWGGVNRAALCSGKAGKGVDWKGKGRQGQAHLPLW